MSLRPQEELYRDPVGPQMGYPSDDPFLANMAELGDPMLELWEWKFDADSETGKPTVLGSSGGYFVRLCGENKTQKYFANFCICFKDHQAAQNFIDTAELGGFISGSNCPL